jgi:ATP-dependent DNA helicase RecG
MNAPPAAQVRRSLESEVQYLKGVGPKLAPMLHKLGLKTVRDVLFYLPRRYDDRRNLPPLSQVRPGDAVTVHGRVVDFHARATSKRGMVVMTAVVSDRTGSIKLVWFNQPWIRKKLEHYRGEILAFGKVTERDWNLEMSAPDFELLEEDGAGEDFARIVPVYPLSEGSPQWLVRKAATSALDGYLGLVEDPLPPRILQDQQLRAIKWALRQIHQPESEEHRAEARKRLVFDEFFFMQVALALRKKEAGQEAGIAFAIGALQVAGAEHPTPIWEEIHRMLPFDLTGAQRRVIGEIFRDMERPHPMNRLVQGDVGSGKTAVAAAAMLAAVRCGYQAALMAPTEILAEQHYANLHRLFETLGIDVELLVGKQTPTQKKKAVERTQSGKAHIAVGTHALIQEGVEFKSLGLVVIDEQHRFGVLQRAALREKGLGNPDVLVMTATPIPRTLTMTMYGDLDLSVIDEMPPGRKPIKTHWKRPFERDPVYEAVAKLVAEGRQAYFVCPMVSESEKMLAQAAEELHERLSTKVFPQFKVGLLHGQMKAKDKEQVMERFRAHDLDILVSTTVIEVGVDVPNASVMVVEDANRFGLSQLHQLRGRVGRGSAQSFCILIADAKNDDAQERMRAMVETADGFRIAEEDLKLRGPGQMMGTAQSGFGDFKIADLVQDAKMLEVARDAAIRLIKSDPDLSRPEHATIRTRALEWDAHLTALVSA